MTTVQIINATLQIWGSLMSLLMALCLHYAGRFRVHSGRLYLVMLILNTESMLFDVIALFLRGRSGGLVTWLLWFTNTVSFACDILMLPSFLHYLLVYLKNHGADVKYSILKTLYLISGVMLLLLLVNPFYPIVFGIDQNNLYFRGKLFVFFHLNGILGLLFAIYLIYKYRRCLLRSECVAMLGCILLPFIAVPLQAFIYGLAFINIGNALSLTVICLVLQVHQARRIAAQENTLLQNRYTRAISQIQPHFIFNVLNSIQSLCKVDPQQAGSTINSFGKYLRLNMDMLAYTEAIPLAEDVRHLENYLCIERLCLPDISVEYDLKSTDLQVPPLTLQPLVENSIKHGISCMKAAGKIWISSWENADTYYLEIKDNGGGFSEVPQFSDDDCHHGIPNTRARIELMCHGQMEVFNHSGEGVTVCIQIPKETV